MDTLPQWISEIMSWDWSSIIQSGTGVATLVIAWIALSSWKAQHKSQKITSLLDQLTGSVHEFLQSVSTPIRRLQLIHIGIDSCQYDMRLNRELKYPEAIRFIEKEGRESATLLMESLNNCDSSVQRIRSLLIKGQILKIKDFDSCQHACEMLIWQYDRLQAVYAILSGQSMNWEHPKVIESVGSLLEITPGNVEQHLKDNQIIFYKFVQQAYESEYKNA